MGARGRAGGRAKLKAIRVKVRLVSKAFTRMRAERALSKGADPTEARFVDHKNKHVVAKAERLAKNR